MNTATRYAGRDEISSAAGGDTPRRPGGRRRIGAAAPPPPPASYTAAARAIEAWEEAVRSMVAAIAPDGRPAQGYDDAGVDLVVLRARDARWAAIRAIEAHTREAGSYLEAAIICGVPARVPAVVLGGLSYVVAIVRGMEHDEGQDGGGEKVLMRLAANPATI